MKQISLLLVTLALCAAPAGLAQDAATEERLNKLSGKIEDLIEGQKAQRRLIDQLSKEIDGLREQQGKPSTTYATPDDLKHITDALKEVDRKRLEDYDKIRTELLKIGRSLSTPGPVKPPKATASGPGDVAAADKSSSPDRGVYEYTVQSGDTLDAIVLAYKEKNIKVTVAQILKANPGLVPEKMRVGQKISIPVP